MDPAQVVAFMPGNWAQMAGPSLEMARNIAAVYSRGVNPFTRPDQAFILAGHTPQPVIM